MDMKSPELWSRMFHARFYENPQDRDTEKERERVTERDRER
jgi:hypothetical protein